ncbi:MAG: hypothetical protein HW390_893 [Candidatus Brocadiaceae bacterium]|nr:hypothetical protein [Candidatus Brocadiaceae bacterium]
MIIQFAQNDKHNYLITYKKLLYPLVTYYNLFHIRHFLAVRQMANSIVF